MTIHQRNLQVLAAEICKAKNDMICHPILLKKFLNKKSLPIAYAHREITLYVGMLKLPITVFSQGSYIYDVHKK